MTVDLVKRLVLTEKSYSLIEAYSQYTFDVDVRLSKPEIKKLFETLYSVTVVSVNTHRLPPRRKGEKGKKPSLKRAIVALKSNQRLPFFQD